MGVFETAPSIASYSFLQNNTAAMAILSTLNILNPECSQGHAAISKFETKGQIIMTERNKRNWSLQTEMIVLKKGRL